METAFKLTHHEKKHMQVRGYTWLREVLYKAPIKFLKDQRKRIIKSIFTHAIYAVEHGKKADTEQFKITCIEIAARMYDVVTLKHKSEYEELILNHFIRIMMEDESVNIRKAVLSCIDFTEKTMPYVILKT